MRLQALPLILLIAASPLQGCSVLKTTFGGSKATDDNRTSSSGPEPLPDSILNQAALFTWTEEATRTHYDLALGLRWQHNLGDWLDANGEEQGSVPFASVTLVDDDTEKVIDINVTTFVSRYGADFMFNRSLGSSYTFHSREAADPSKRPQLIVEKSASVFTYDPAADTSLDNSSLASRGCEPTLNTADGFLVRFDFIPDAQVTRVTLRLHATTMQYGGQFLELYRPNPRPALPASPVFELGNESDVMLRLSGASLYSQLGSTDRGTTSVDSSGRLAGAVPFNGDRGLGTSFAIPAPARTAEIFLRTVMKIGADFDPSSAGVLPGLSSSSGWSARTVFESDPSATFGREYLKLRGDVARPEAEFSIPLRRDEFFILDQRIKLNSFASNGAANADGEWSYWHNGICVMHTGGVVFRALPGALPTDILGEIAIGSGSYQASHPHSFVIDSMTLSRRLLPVDESALAVLNGN
ncbi:MAG: hypothetical protein AAB250_07540 [Bdellovibrionota bacterium]